jgi:amidase
MAGAILLHPARTPPGAWAAGSSTGAFSVVEATIPDMRKALEQGHVTSRELVTQYLTRIAVYEDLLNAVITVNSRAFAEAEARDRERAQGRVRGPLHGIPIALKDIIHTKRPADHGRSAGLR